MTEPDEAAKQLLLGFNDKVARLEQTRFHQRFIDEPPSLTALFDRVDHFEISKEENAADRLLISIQGYVRMSVDEFDQDEIDAFVLTYRMLTQDNDRYSVRRLAKLYESPWVEEDARSCLADARAEIKKILDATARVDFG